MTPSRKSVSSVQSGDTLVFSPTFRVPVLAVAPGDPFTVMQLQARAGGSYHCTFASSQTVTVIEPEPKENTPWK
jgi:hypothetical protein